MVTIACDALSVSLGQRRVLDGLSLTFEPGRLVGIIGPNGAGKSTLLRAMVGLLPPDAGGVTIDGEPIAQVPRRDLARRIAYLPQGQTVHWPISVERLVSLGRLPHLAPMSRIAKADSDAIERAMARADVSQFRDRIATELSGGERARVMLARALAVEAAGLIVDEPLAALDPGHQIDVMELLRRETEAGLLVIVVLHDLTTAARYCDRLVLLNHGKAVDDGAPMAVLTPDRLREVYGITARIEQNEDGGFVVPRGRVA
ncbi:ABC transporter ATP-binding protein [Sphingomonas sp. MG17]|uniref:ABC transporter ATP-binding protein n=1 Tax=Sphingomonas tagetis TaxID=2949092 RepID=A0A9X2HET5_9SPHN|nr:ABC transporter ATP-binding protein [Sphingomonas tagetis]MCP3729811.1 ABC transporter ATP-binding protein [Sphingomonas tagetis]